MQNMQNIRHNITQDSALKVLLNRDCPYLNSSLNPVYLFIYLFYFILGAREKYI